MIDLFIVPEEGKVVYDFHLGNWPEEKKKGFRYGKVTPFLSPIVWCNFPMTHAKLFKCSWLVKTFDELIMRQVGWGLGSRPAGGAQDSR
jgi:hypothetical protein